MVLLSGAQAQAQTEERVSLKGGRISFVPPAGFKPWSKEAIASMFGRDGAPNAPEVIYSDERKNASLVVGFTVGGLQAEQLDEAKQGLEGEVNHRVPGVEWIEREIITRNGRRWIHLYWKAPTADVGFVNDLYVTIFDGQLLMFTFKSTIAQYENYKDSLRRSAQTITVK
jgi:hypothetical protein